MDKDTYKVLGMMSGTSLDGLDLAFCHFEKIENQWYFEILKSHTFSYSQDWKEKLGTAVYLDGASLSKLNIEYGAFLGNKAQEFLKNYELHPNFIASHGHTVFHQPEHRLTLQIGAPWEIAAKTQYKVIADFRSKDLALGGQGAPLVPIGDRLLFGNYDFCLNLGGIANISLECQGKRIAFDICPANMLLNDLAKSQNLEFDRGGALASKGNIDYDLLSRLNDLAYYQLSPPKSLGWEWYAGEMKPILGQFNISLEDQLRTAVEHIAFQIALAVKALKPHGNSIRMLCCGGGVKNTFLIRQIQEKAPLELSLEIPSETLIDFKEAMVFAFLGVLCEREEVNCLASVTGASKDHCSGLSYLP